MSTLIAYAGDALCLSLVFALGAVWERAFHLVLRRSAA